MARLISRHPGARYPLIPDCPDGDLLPYFDRQVGELLWFANDQRPSGTPRGFLAHEHGYDRTIAISWRGAVICDRGGVRGGTERLDGAR